MSSSQARPQGLPLGGWGLEDPGKHTLQLCPRGAEPGRLRHPAGGGSPRGPDTMPDPPTRAPRPTTFPGKRGKRAVSRD